MGIQVGSLNPLNENILYYTSSATWNKGSNVYAVLVTCIGPGGGGGGGRRGVAQNLGGCGGGGGAIVQRWIQASELSSSVIITVPTGGAGGLGATAISTNGSNGSQSSPTSFGSWVIAASGGSGSGGLPGTTPSSGGGPVNLCTPNWQPFAFRGGTGSASTGPTDGTTGFFPAGQMKISGPALSNNFTHFTAGGGMGGGWTSTNTIRSASNGGGIYTNYSSSVSALTSFVFGSGSKGSDNIAGGITAHGTSGSSNILPHSGYWLFDSRILTTLGLGAGGGGGSFGSSSFGGNGGDGGNYGAGGGGGGSASNVLGCTAGNGGKGGDGLCIVVEYYR